MNDVQPSGFLPLWQGERERLIHQACLAVERKIAKGAGIMESLERTARYYNRRQFKSDPGRTLRLSFKSLTRFYYAWRRSGKSPESFRLKLIFSHRPFVSIVFVRFADYLLQHQNRSFETNWKLFSAKAGNFAPGRRWRDKAIQAALKKRAEIETRVLKALQAKAWSKN